MTHRHSFARIALAIALLVGLWARPGLALHIEIDALLDLDDDPATGCTIATPEGPFPGVERVAVSELIVDVVPVVEFITLRDCEGHETEVEVEKGGIPYAVGGGVAGFDAIETFVPLEGLPVGSRVRVGFVARKPGTEVADAILTTDGSSAGAAIVLPLGDAIVAVPALGAWGVAVLALALATVAILALRLRRRPVTVLVILVGLAAGSARATLEPDGDVSGWTEAFRIAVDRDDPQLGTAPRDAGEGADLLRAYGAVEGGRLLFRIDADLAFPPFLTSSGHHDFLVGGPPVAVDPALVAFDFDDTELAGGRATMVNRPDGAAENLAVDTSGTAITASWDGAMGILTLAGTDTLAHYQEVFRRITYSNASASPDPTVRSIDLVLRDETDDGVALTSSIRIVFP